MFSVFSNKRYSDSTLGLLVRHSWRVHGYIWYDIGHEEYLFAKIPNIFTGYKRWLQKVDDIGKMYFVYDKINFNFPTMNH